MRALKRLIAIADLIDDAETVADIGCDHGYLGKMLVKSGKSKKIIAIDINSQSLAKTEKLAKKCHIQDKIEARLGDGLKPLQDGETDTVVIAGLGGHTIVDILKQKELLGVKEYVFQPAQKSDFLKIYLQQNKFKIICDFIVKDKNKFYNIVKAVRVNKNIKLDEEEILFSLTDFDQYNNDLLEYIDAFIERVNAFSETGKNLKAEHQLSIANNLKNKIINKETEKCKK
ncbi:MAG: SAM-dependent methyltransferase [Clostridia bacterium]|nr:SAM-dependent methyltransferase [Clostridia bacterium]